MAHVAQNVNILLNGFHKPAASLYVMDQPGMAGEPQYSQVPPEPT